MTVILRISNLLSFLRKAESVRAETEERSAKRAAARALKIRTTERPSAAAEEYGARATADAWQYACNQRAFR
ncbi:MAG: hypothetical protein GX430_11225 [Treponema sp.]|nr:hypothetical protein [Treponema sp.]